MTPPSFTWKCILQIGTLKKKFPLRKIIFFSSPINRIFLHNSHLGVISLPPPSPENPLKEIKGIFKRRRLQATYPLGSYLFRIRKQNPIYWWREKYDFPPVEKVFFSKPLFEGCTFRWRKESSFYKIKKNIYFLQSCLYMFVVPYPEWVGGN